jgi:curved DNA-binding protein CbpA
MTLQRNHYEVLGVARKASTDEIKKKYRELARQFHPDIAKDKSGAEKIFSQINQAYRVLGDPDRRAQYDAALAADTSERGASGARAGVATPSGVSNGASAAQRAAAAPLSPQQAANMTRLVGEAETAMLQNNIGKVKQICDLVLKTDPRNQKALNLLGDALMQMGKPQDAAAAFRQALEIAPSFAIQAKLDRLQGRPAVRNGAPNGMSPNGAAPRTPPSPYTPPANGAQKPGQPGANPGRATTDQGRSDKPAGGLLSRLLGKK